MPMERSLSCAERSITYKPAAPGTDLRCYSASYATSYAPARPTKVQSAKSTSSSWSRPSAASSAVQRSASTKTVAGSGPRPGLNLRCYSASYAASYAPSFSDDAGAEKAKKGPNAAAWSNAGRRSLNLRSYTPSFAALVDEPVPAKRATADPGGFDDAELQRKKRLVTYKVYDVEGKVKDSVRRSVKWIKDKYSRAVYGGGD